jgi:uncharacterized coiled-coil protein SlyX
MARSISDALSGSMSRDGDEKDVLPPITADSSTEEVMRSLLGRLQQLESKVSAQDALIRSLQRGLADNKSINQEMLVQTATIPSSLKVIVCVSLRVVCASYLGLSNKMGKLEKQGEAQQRQAARTETSCSEMLTAQEEMRRQMDEFSVTLAALAEAPDVPSPQVVQQMVVAVEPQQQMVQRVGLSEAERAELVKTILAALPSLSRPVSAQQPRPSVQEAMMAPPALVALQAETETTKYAHEETVQAPPRKPVPETASAAAAYQKELQKNTPSVVHHHHHISTVTAPAAAPLPVSTETAPVTSANVPQPLTHPPLSPVRILQVRQTQRL